jgi:hypothetical protein
MELVNTTEFPAGMTVGFRKDGRELVVVAIKGTFTFEANGDGPSLAAEQEPLTEADKSNGEPGVSSILYETDYAHHKPFCDVLVNGCAHAPAGGAVRSIEVGLEVGPIRKRFRTVGHRYWERGLISGLMTEPEPFTSMPISYDCAFGGADASDDNSKIMTYAHNPVGIGYYPLTRGRATGRNKLPNTEEIGKSVSDTNSSYRPMSFGTVGRNFKSRIAFAGSYDDQWLRRRAPLFPEDFDPRYFQAAPTDQQMPYPGGGEDIVLESLTPNRYVTFKLPTVTMPVVVLPHNAREWNISAVVDTILIEPARLRFMLTWRATIPVRKNCFELRQIVVGQGRKRQVAISDNKPHYASIAAYIRAKKGKGR